MLHTTTTAMLLVALLLGTPFTLAAQEPDPPDEEQDRWAAEVGFTLNGSGGNENLTVLVTQIALNHLETKSYELSLDGRYRYGRSEGEDVANSLSGSLTGDFMPESRWSPFVFATAERDPFKRLEVRLSTGTGMKHTFHRNGRDEVSLSGAVLYDYEDTEPDSTGANGIRRTARWSWRARARHEVREGTRFEQVAFFIPAWDRWEDYRIESRSSARVALTRTLAFTATALYERDNTPAPGVGADDWSVGAGLSVATRW